MRHSRAVRFAMGAALSLSGAAARNRRRFYDGGRGLRIATLHETRGPAQMDALARIVDACAARHSIVEPSSAVSSAATSTGDTLLFSFDDGYADNFDAAEYLAKNDIKAVFFVIPSFLGRTVREFFEFHERRGVTPAGMPTDQGELRGLAPSQLREMISMGHVIAAHNYAHRDLGKLPEPEDLDYEIGNALEDLSNILQTSCRDFAWGFGRINNLTPAAYRYLSERCDRIYSCVRGLNLPGGDPKMIFRDQISLDYPMIFNLNVLNGALDDRYAGERSALKEWPGQLSH